jgi:hypothetical protein
MSAIRIGPFGGANLALRPKLLDNNVGVASLNHNPDEGDLRPWKVPLAHTTIGSGKKTIHMLGRDLVTDTIYWFEWTTVVHAIGSLKSDDTTKRTYYSGSGAPKVTDNIIGLAGAPFPTAYRDLGVPKPLTAPTLTETTPGTGDDETRYYAYTYLTDWDEEGPPAVSAPIVCKPGALINITGMSLAPTGPGETRGINRIRIYRTVAGAAGAEFYFLRDIAIATSSADDARDTGTDICPSALYALPPTDLFNLIELWNGMAAGITGKAVRYCEPYRMHAWPVAYETLCHDKPIALGVYGKNLVIATTGKPIVVSGSAPEAMDGSPVEFLAGCVSAQSMVSLGHGVAWATADGLAYVGTAHPPSLLTAECMLLDDWKALNPETIIGCQYNGLYFGFYNASGLKGFVFNPLAPKEGIRFLSAGYSAAFFDKLSEEMYVLNGTSVQRWNAGASNMTAEFTSKVFRMPAPVNLAVAEVVADAYPCTMTLYADARTPWVRSVTSKKPFTLPAGYSADDYQIKISTDKDVTGIVLAETLDELSKN